MKLLNHLPHFSFFFFLIAIIDHSDFTGKSYVFSWSDILNYDNGFYRSFYTCHGDRLILSTADYFNTVGINIFYYAQFQSFTDGQYYPPSYTYQYIPTQSGSGIYFEFVNDLQQCGSLTVTAYCGITSSWSSYCGGEMTVKRFYEYYGGYNPNIYKPEVTDRNDMCYDQSQYFCSSPTCLTPSVSTNNSWESYCATAFNGFGSICPKNATCAHGKYKCDAGFTDFFKLDHYIVDPNDCTACQMPRGCVPDTTIFPPSTSIVSTYSYNVSDSFANSLNYVNVSFGNICGKNISVYGCTDNQFGDQFIELTDRYGSRFFHNDDINTWRICSYVKPEWSINGMCQDAYMRLGCFGPGSCGGSVKVAIGVGCEPGTYSTTGFKPCVACPAGLNTSHSQSTGCHECATGYIGFNGTAPCVPCPDGYIAHNHMSCELCNANVLHTMTGDLYNTCLAKLLTKTETLEQRVDGMVAAFDQYLEDIKYGMPTVHPTAMPTRRRRSRAPTAGGM